MAAAALSPDAIAQVMNITGPTVTAVVLKADGTAEQISIDTSPKVNAAAALLKGNPTFIGQWTSLNVVLMCSKITGDDWPINQHKLPHPFSKIEVKGDVLLLRINDDAVPADFTKEEWERFTSERDENSAADEEDCGPLQISASDLIDQIDEVADEDDDEDDEEFEAEEDSEEDSEEDDEEYDENDEDDEEAHMEQDGSLNDVEADRSEQ